MKDKIRHIHLPHLRNEEYLGFHSEFNHLLKECSPAGTLQALVVLYQECLAELEKSLKVIRKSTYTLLLADVDRQRNATYRTLRFAIAGYLWHEDPKLRRVAVSLNNIIKHYGNIPKMSRDEKTYSIVNMLQDLSGKISDDLPMLGISHWIDELGRNNDAYQSLKDLRYEEWAQQASLNVKSSRKALDFTYHAIIRQMEIQGLLNPEDPELMSSITAVNERVELYGRLIAQRAGIRAHRNTPTEGTTIPAGDST